MRKLLGLALAFLLLVPGGLLAYSGASQEELLKRIEELSKEIEMLKKQLQEVKEAQEETSDTVDEMSDLVENFKDNMGKFQIWGDIRTRVDSTRAYVPDSYLGYFSGFKYDPTENKMIPVFGGVRNEKGHKENDTIWTNRMRINFKVRPTENTVVKVRLAYYKIWGNSDDYVSPEIFPGMDNNFTFGVRPSDSRLYVDRAYFNWVNVGGYPVWISFGRRPTTHGVPQHLREGLDKREATPQGINIDVPFDGATIGYQYRWPFPGRIRFCYGKGFESGFKTYADRAKDDVDFYGFAWDVIDDPDRDMHLFFQAFKAEGIMDFPEGTFFFNDLGPMYKTAQSNLGDLYEIGLTWLHKVDIPYIGLEGVDYFLSLGLSIADPDEIGEMPVDMSGLGFGVQKMYYSLLGGFYLNPNQVDMDTHTGWAVYVGARIPLPWIPGAKLGLEYNYGSKWWMPFLVATDDIYINKLATRGHVAEVYWVQDLPTGEALNKYAKVFLRLGFQYFWFNYSGSGNWLGEPHEINELDDVAGMPANMQLFVPLDHMYNLYASFEIYF
ncbi:DUF3373 family protein [Thermosulfurimonas dismutans]|uniref:DUF3373 family protein n=1 Tax=Thermosulfurimonas dismutans TaxID=999894 RepID=A0A179D1Q8_9BACT|nr:DUF3373 family protein [Thermosulfurimonas dismutans]OAQ19923.1 hypothetical protein TDIS_1995 [Thermosulfurimonas dismutans]